MLTTAEAMARVLAAVPALAAEDVPLGKALSRTLAEPIAAERDQPPFDRVMMDGIAISFTAFQSGQREFEIQGMQAAGDAVLTLEDGKAIEIMTGASLPNGADCIVPVERTTTTGNRVTVEADYETERLRFVHPCASDHAKGTLLLTVGKRIAAADIAVIASCGRETVSCAREARIAIVSTGNELVPAGQEVADHQVRLSNGPAIQALLSNNGFGRSNHTHIVDDVDTLQAKLAELLANNDVLVLSGGVSMGKADYVPQVLEDLGVAVDFHKITQRPGKPMWFGMGPDGQSVFALPGNPVSAMVCCRQYVVPALLKMSGTTPSPPQFATLASDVVFKPQLTNFLPAKLLSNAAGQVLAMPVQPNTSGDFASLSGTDGYVELEKDRSHFKSGMTVPLHRWTMLS